MKKQDEEKKDDVEEEKTCNSKQCGGTGGNGMKERGTRGGQRRTALSPSQSSSLHPRMGYESEGVKRCAG